MTIWILQTTNYGRLLSLSSISTFVGYLMPNTIDYIYIYIGWPQKNRTHIFLTEIHKFNSSLFFISGYEVDSVHEKLGP